MSVIIQHTAAELDQMIQAYRQQQPTDFLLKVTQYKTALKKQLSLENKFVVLSGHQPIFFHPGILAKDELAQSIAKLYNGIAVSLILDIDQESIDFSYPSRGAVKKTLPLSNENRIINNQKLNQTKRLQLLNAIDQSLTDLSATLTPVAAERSRPYLFHLRETVKSTNELIKITNSVREFHAIQKGWNVKYVQTSELILSDAFRFLATAVFERSSEFRNLFNETLSNYRELHNIKNHAQPFPNLNEDELPFWIIDKSGARRHLTDQDIEKSGFFSAGNDSSDYLNLFKEGRILPKAITLSMFLRMFICDIMIHGTGGSRYDQITEIVGNKFFGCLSAPITVSTATLRLPARADFPIYSYTYQELKSMQRKLEFDPTRFLPVECPLQEEQRILIKLRSNLTGNHQHKLIEKIPLLNLNRVRPEFANRIQSLIPRLTQVEQNPPALINQEFLRLRRLATPYMKQKKKELSALVKRSEKCNHADKLFSDRTLPFFYYDLTEIEAASADFANKKINQPLAEQSI